MILELGTCTRIDAHVSGTLEMREIMSITEADHLQEWFSSAATRGERVIYIISSLWELTQLQHYSLASIDQMSNVKSGVPIKPFSVSYELYSD